LVFEFFLDFWGFDGLAFEFFFGVLMDWLLNFFWVCLDFWIFGFFKGFMNFWFGFVWILNFRKG
jgi:hypothetical protein